jgi:hypothetical protein
MQLWHAVQVVTEPWHVSTRSRSRAHLHQFNNNERARHARNRPVLCKQLA